MILVVESDASVRHLVKINLEKRGHTVHAVESPTAALDVLRQHSPRVVILDVWLPGKGGYALLDRLSSDLYYPELKLILISSMPITDTLPPHVVEVLNMPMKVEEILAAVNMALSN
jgi:DNA-binding NtrC family response regulator